MYDFKAVEKEIADFWKKEKIYEKAKQKNIKGEPFYFCDGPPYATGQIHPGTAWNKTIKDAFCRYMRMRGYNVRAQPGYDTHGLPIEVKVEQELEIKNKAEIEKKIGIEKFIKKCRDFATKYIGVMGDQFLSLGIWMDFDDPYITYKDSFIESSWKTLKLAHEQGLMHEGSYVLPYCFRCETTIANYELEYAEETDPSIYVKFKLDEGDANDYLIIWTTTPWTLVGNMAVMVHPTLTYVKVKVDEEIWVVAKQRLEHLLEMTGKSGVIMEEVSGKKLEGKKYLHPFQEKIKKEYPRRVVLSDEYVTVEDGTGLVHCAPGHGPEDFIIGKRFDIEIFSPVDEHGNYTKEAGDFAGKNVRKANAEIIKMLKDKGVILHEARIRHRYPHCWRCKTQLIFLATKQWFIAISKMKEKMLAEVDATNWTPAFAKERFKEFVNNAPDWCISRQRYWGIPLPIWKCTKCDKMRVLGSKEELGAEVKELHRPYIDEIELVCECKGKMKRIPDVLDVWFDSGNAVWASLDAKEEKTYNGRADLIIEGQDQIRGWFYSLLGSGVVKYGHCPYKSILMHGFFVDEKGEKMSKSVGNFVPLEDIIAKYGADSFRLWGTGNTIWEELKFNWDDLKESNGDLNTLFNLVTFLERFYPAKKISVKGLAPEDKWLVSKTNNVLKAYREAFAANEPNRAINAVRDFAVDEISRFYMKIAKDRIAREDNSDAALCSIYYAVFTSIKLLAPVTPFTSEYLYQRFFRKYEKQASISFFSIEDEVQADINLGQEKEMETVKEIITSALTARQEAKIKVRWPIRNLYIETKSHETKESLKNLSGIISRLVNVKNIIVSETSPGGEVVEAAFSGGKIHLEKNLDEELYEEGVINEVKRRVQSMRKTQQFVEKDSIEITLGGDNEIVAIIEKGKSRLMKEVNAKKLVAGESKKAEEFEIDGRTVKITIEKS
jgi:isoleucyl-tRNA synthetase